MKKYLALSALLIAAALPLLSGSGANPAERAADFFYRAKDRLPVSWPNVHWEKAPPHQLGVDPQALNEMSAQLAANKTRALLVIRNGKLIHEFIAADRNVNELFYIAAMSKTVTAAMATGLLLADENLQLDQPLSKHIPQWQADEARRMITPRHILTHSSGIEDVNFEGEQDGWHIRYYENPEQRFKIVLDQAPINFVPGDHYEYSGVGFYALAYAIGEILRTSQHTNIHMLLQQRLMQPLEIPLRDWSISYAESYDVDGMELYAIGSGGKYSPRAVARIGQLILDRGTWQGEQILPGSAVDRITQYGGSPPMPEENSANPPAGLGVWLNCNGFWPDMPRDLIIGAGAKHQILLIIPSLDVVLVRLGGALGEDHWEGDYWQTLEPALFAPLRKALNYSPDGAVESSRCG